MNRRIWLLFEPGVLLVFLHMTLPARPLHVRGNLGVVYLGDLIDLTGTVIS